MDADGPSMSPAPLRARTGVTPQEGTGSQLWQQDFEKIPPPLFFRPHFLRFLCLQA